MEVERTLRRLGRKIVVLVSLCVVSATVPAELRVLFRFDESGHHIHSLTHAPTFKSLRSLPLDNKAELARSNQPDWRSASQRVEDARARLRTSTATLLWFSESGAWLGNTEEPDPRVTHAPAHIDGVNKSQAGLNEGAWLATGPDEATRVTILFPAFMAVALGPEEWHIDLPVD